MIKFLLCAIVCLPLFAQTLDFCKYITLKVEEMDYNGKKVNSFRPVLLNYKDEAYKFFNKHFIRFDYILMNKAMDESYKISSYFPDTIKIRDSYCLEVLNSRKMKNYLSSVTPKKFVSWPAEKYSFSHKEMMEVAARFFYPDRIIFNEKDTSVGSHICVGINGVKELKFNRDLTVLEAFCVEAIMLNIIDKKSNHVMNFYSKHLRRITREKLRQYKDKESFLLEVRNAIYPLMEQNRELKKCLLRYYKK